MNQFCRSYSNPSRLRSQYLNEALLVKLLKIIILMMFFLLAEMKQPRANNGSCGSRDYLMHDHASIPFFFVKANCQGNGKAPEINPSRVNSIVIPFLQGGASSASLTWSDYYILPDVQQCEFKWCKWMDQGCNNWLNNNLVGLSFDNDWDDNNWLKYEQNIGQGYSYNLCIKCKDDDDQYQEYEFSIQQTPAICYGIATQNSNYNQNDQRTCQSQMDNSGAITTTTKQQLFQNFFDINTGLIPGCEDYACYWGDTCGSSTVTGPDVLQIIPALTIEYPEQKSITKDICIECSFTLESYKISLPFRIEVTTNCEANGDARLITTWSGGPMQSGFDTTKELYYMGPDIEKEVMPELNSIFKMKQPKNDGDVKNYWEKCCRIDCQITSDCSATSVDTHLTVTPTTEIIENTHEWYDWSMLAANNDLLGYGPVNVCVVCSINDDPSSPYSKQFTVQQFPLACDGAYTPKPEFMTAATPLTFPFVNTATKIVREMSQHFDELGKYCHVNLLSCVVEMAPCGSGIPNPNIALDTSFTPDIKFEFTQNVVEGWGIMDSVSSLFVGPAEVCMRCTTGSEVATTVIFDQTFWVQQLPKDCTGTLSWTAPATIDIVNPYVLNGLGQSYDNTYFFTKNAAKIAIGCEIESCTYGDSPWPSTTFVQGPGQISTTSMTPWTIDAVETVIEGYGPYSIVIECTVTNNNKWHRIFTIEQIKLDCSGLLVPKNAGTLVIQENYLDSPALLAKTFTDFFTETTITNCAVLVCNYGDSCGEFTLITGPNVIPAQTTPIASPYTLNYVQNVIIGYGPQAICIQCKVTNDYIDDQLFTVNQFELDCTGLLVPVLSSAIKVISEIYVDGPNTLTLTKNYLDFFTETPITNCAVLECNYGDTCGQTTTISGTNVAPEILVPTTPYTLKYSNNIKDGYGPQALCIRCKVTNNYIDDQLFTVQQLKLNCDESLVVRTDVTNPVRSYTYDSLGSPQALSYTDLFTDSSIAGCILDCTYYKDNCSSTPDQEVTVLIPINPWTLSSPINDIKGYSNDLCLKCTSNNMVFLSKIETQFTIEQLQLDCTLLLTPKYILPAELLIIGPYLNGGADLTKQYLDFFTETPITNCQIESCNYGDSCGQTKKISGTNVYQIDSNITPYELKYQQNFKDGYGPQEICAQCKVTNNKKIDQIFKVEQLELNCDGSLVPIPVPINPISFDYELGGTAKTYLYDQFFTYLQIPGCDLQCQYNKPDCSSALPLDYKVTVSSLIQPWSIVAPIDVVEGYLLNEICLYCTSNNLVDITFSDGFRNIFTIEQPKLDCTDFLQQVLTTPIIFFNLYTYGGTTEVVNYNTFFNTQVIPSCEVQDCTYYWNSCGDSTPNTEPNIVFDNSVGTPYTLTYEKAFKDGYGPHDLCIECEATNGYKDSQSFQIEQQKLDCDPTLVPITLPNLFVDPNLVKNTYVNSVQDLTFNYLSYFTYLPIDGCNLDCRYSQVANPTTTEPNSVKIDSPGLNPWQITAPTNVIKGYKEDFVFTCDCNNLYAFPSYVKSFTIEQEKLDCTKFLTVRTEPDPLTPEVISLTERSLKYQYKGASDKDVYSPEQSFSLDTFFVRNTDALSNYDDCMALIDCSYHQITFETDAITGDINYHDPPPEFQQLQEEAPVGSGLWVSVGWSDDTITPPVPIVAQNPFKMAAFENIISGYDWKTLKLECTANSDPYEFEFKVKQISLQDCPNIMDYLQPPTDPLQGNLITKTFPYQFEGEGMTFPFEDILIVDESIIQYCVINCQFGEVCGEDVSINPFVDKDYTNYLTIMANNDVIPGYTSSTCVECISQPRTGGTCIPNAYDKDSFGCEVTPDGTLYSAYPGKNKDFVSIDSKTSVQTRNDCANFCSLKKDCGSCFYNNSTLNCDLFAEQYVNPHIFKVQEEPNWNFLYKINKGTTWTQPFEIIQESVICNETLTPVEQTIIVVLPYEVTGRGKTFDYLDFFEDNKTPGCVISCKLVDDEAPSNPDGGCTNSTTQEPNVMMKKDEQSPWQFIAWDNSKEPYTSEMCMVCTPELGGDAFFKKFKIIQVTDTPPDTGIYTHLELNPFPGEMVYEYYGGSDLKVMMTSVFFRSSDSLKPIIGCKLYIAPECKLPVAGSQLLLLPSGPQQIIIQTNEKDGWSKTVCVQCNTATENRMSGPWKVTQLPVDCTGKLEAKSTKIGEFSYNEQNNTQLYMDSLFKNKDTKSCPLELCELQSQGCGSKFDDDLIRMAEGQPFNISVLSVEQGFSKTVCITCQNGKDKVKYDNLKLAQAARPLDCFDSLSMNPNAQSELLMDYKYNQFSVIKPIDNYFRNKHVLCFVEECKMMYVGCTTEMGKKDNIKFEKSDNNWKLVIQRDTQLGYKEEFCMKCWNNQQTIIQDKITVIQESQFNFTVWPVMGWIDSISVVGEMQIKFNTTMKVNLTDYSNNDIIQKKSGLNETNITDYQNLYLLNSSSITMYLLPEGDWHKESEGFDLNRLNFTWNCTRYEQDARGSESTLYFNLKFNSPTDISPFAEQDQIFVNLTDVVIPGFIASKDGIKLRREDYTLQKKIRLQMEQNPTSDVFLQSTAIFNGGSEQLFIYTFITNLFIAGVFALMTMWIHSMQLIMHLPILQVIVPSNVSAYFEAIAPILTFDFLPSDYTTEYVFDFDFATQRDLEYHILDQMKNLGYNTHNSIIILGSLGLLAFISLSMMFFYMIAILPLQYFTGKTYRKFRKMLFFTSIIKLIHGGYFEILIACYLNVRYPVDTMSGETAAQMVAYIYFFISLFLLPCVWFIGLRRSVKNMNTRRFQSRFGALFEDIKKKSKWSMIYYLIFILRRQLFCIIAFSLQSYPCLQVQFVMYTNLFIFIYIGSIRPFITRQKNYIEMFNEVCITIITGHELFFTDLMPTRSGQFNVGWSMIMIMVFNTLFNFCIVLKMVLWNTYLVFLKNYWLLRRCCDKDFMRELPQDVNPEIEEAKQNEIIEPNVIKDDINVQETNKEESKKENGDKSDRKKSDRKSLRKQVRFEDDIQKNPKTKLSNKKVKIGLQVKFEDVSFQDIDFQNAPYPNLYDSIHGINKAGDPNHLIGKDYFKKYNDENDKFVAESELKIQQMLKEQNQPKISSQPSMNHSKEDFIPAFVKEEMAQAIRDQELKDKLMFDKRNKAKHDPEMQAFKSEQIARIKKQIRDERELKQKSEEYLNKVPSPTNEHTFTNELGAGEFTFRFPEGGSITLAQKPESNTTLLASLVEKSQRVENKSQSKEPEQLDGYDKCLEICNEMDLKYKNFLKERGIVDDQI